VALQAFYVVLGTKTIDNAFIPQHCSALLSMLSIAQSGFTKI
jgi:hypothetical protein